MSSPRCYDQSDRLRYFHRSCYRQRQRLCKQGSFDVMVILRSYLKEIYWLIRQLSNTPCRSLSQIQLVLKSNILRIF